MKTMTQLLGTRESRESGVAFEHELSVSQLNTDLGPLVSGSFDNRNGSGMNYAEYKQAIMAATNAVTIDRVSDGFDRNDE